MPQCTRETGWGGLTDTVKEDSTILQAGYNRSGVVRLVLRPEDMMKMINPEERGSNSRVS